MEVKNKASKSEGSILIVDDDQYILLFLETILTKAGFTSYKATNGKQALELARQHHPDIILSDLMMPVMDGTELCRQIRSDPELKSTYFIVLTAKKASTDKISLLNLGADDFISKPFSSEELLAKISASMRVVNLQNELRKKNEKLQQVNQELQKINQELKETHACLLQQEKMASIGQLAAGVAHEINNPISFVYSNLSVLKEYLQDIKTLIQQYENYYQKTKDKVNGQFKADREALDNLKKELDCGFLLEDLEKIVAESLEGAERVRRIVQDLKDFSHVDQAEIKWVDLNQGLESTLNIVWNAIKYKAKVIKEYGKIPLVKCYPMQINQVFMNILVNAAQAIEDHGIITIKTFSKDDKVYIQISDTGVGIPKENLSKIFEPFFTTKEVGEGTGLGLSIVYNVIKKHGGKISVESKVGQGTTFTIELPVEPALEEKEQCSELVSEK